MRRLLQSPGVWIGLLALAMVAIARGPLASFPHSADEYVFLYQARTFAAGQLRNPPLPEPAFQPIHVVATPEATFGKYPLGWPAVLAPGAAVGLPHAVNALVVAGILGLAFRLARRLQDDRTAWATLGLLGTSPFLLLHGASYYSQPLAALAMLAAAAALLAYHESGARRWILSLALCLGALVLTRPFDAALAALAGGPFALAALLRHGRSAWRHAALALGVVGACVVVYGLYNAATTGDALTPAHALWNPQDRPSWAGFRTPLPTLRRALEYALFAPACVVFPLAAVVLWRGGLRVPVAFATLVVGLFWVGYAAYPIASPPRLGPRFLLPIHAFAALVVAGGLAQVIRRGWLGGCVAMLAALQLSLLALMLVELRSIVGRGTAVFRAAAALATSIAPKQALVVLAGPSGTIPAPDLTRNDRAFQQPVLFARRRLRGEEPWARTRFADRYLYYWDGVGGAPALWSPDPRAPFPLVFSSGAQAVAVPRSEERGWVAVFGENACEPPPLLSLLWSGRFPPDRLSDVQRPPPAPYGPCPGWQLVRLLPRVGLPADLPRRRALTAHFRSFLQVHRAVRLRFALQARERAILRVAGESVVEASDGGRRTGVLRLDPGAYAIAVSQYALWADAELALELAADEPDAFELRPQVQPDLPFRGHLPAGALRID